jgi:hypothetical protein
MGFGTVQQAKSSSPSASEELSFTVYADRYGPAQELTERRHSFTARSLSRAVSVDRRCGIVILEPAGTRLRVGSEADDYERIRIVERSRGLVGTMSCDAEGTVKWRAVAADGVPPELT